MTILGNSNERDAVAGAPARATDATATAGEDSGGVRGERGSSFVNSARSIQSRASSVLAAGLMMTLGLGALTWYYANAITRQSRARQVAQATAATRAQGEMPLPSLGHVEGPRIAPPTAVLSPAAEAPSTEKPPLLDQEQPHPGTLRSESPRELPLAPYSPIAGGHSAPAPKTPGRLAFERRLSGAAFSRQSTSGAASNDPSVATPDMEETGGSNLSVLARSAGSAGASGQVMSRSDGQSASSGTGDDRGMAALLRPSVTPATRARVLPTQRFLLPKGAFIDCTLETAIDSTLPGMTTCITATDTFGVDGRVVLLERGTKLVGETRGQVQQGAARIFVLWTEARTPSGVIVPLDSPGTDELGRSGLPGDVQRHFWDRFGAAILISTIEGAMQSVVQSSGHGGGTVIYNPSASQGVLTEVFKSTLNIPPTVIKRNGDRIQVLVARDIDFRSVYELKAAAHDAHPAATDR